MGVCTNPVVDRRENDIDDEDDKDEEEEKKGSGGSGGATARCCCSKGGRMIFCISKNGMSKLSAVLVAWQREGGCGWAVGVETSGSGASSSPTLVSRRGPGGSRLPNEGTDGSGGEGRRREVGGREAVSSSWVGVGVGGTPTTGTAADPLAAVWRSSGESAWGVGSAVVDHTGGGGARVNSGSAIIADPPGTTTAPPPSSSPPPPPPPLSSFTSRRQKPLRKPRVEGEEEEEGGGGGRGAVVVPESPRIRVGVHPASVLPTPSAMVAIDGAGVAGVGSFACGCTTFSCSSSFVGNAVVLFPSWEEVWGVIPHSVEGEEPWTIKGFPSNAPLELVVVVPSKGRVEAVGLVVTSPAPHPSPPPPPPAPLLLLLLLLPPPPPCRARKSVRR